MALVTRKTGKKKKGQVNKNDKRKKEIRQYANEIRLGCRKKKARVGKKLKKVRKRWKGRRTD